ncbi:MAG: hypothetical protein WBS20_13375 [Lysobacterales bacterium]
MQGYIAPLLLLIVLFIGFGLSHRRGEGPASCAGCTGEDCSGKSECSNEGKSRHH